MIGNISHFKAPILNVSFVPSKGGKTWFPEWIFWPQGGITKGKSRFSA
jgi:hypothetical protein